LILSVAEAARRLADGELVALPTETVYGLAARADDDAAVAKIFAAKGRPADHPLIVHVADAARARGFSAAWPDLAERLTAACWPGPLTVIVPRRPELAQAAAGGQDSIGLRCPAHPVFHEVLEAAALLGVPGLAAPSANRFGRVSPTTAAHVEQEFEGQNPRIAVVDGGACAVGIESTIVDCTRPYPVLLRPGMLDAAQLETLLGEPLRAPDAQAPRASGTLEAHYAPRARVRLFEPAALAAALRGATPGGLTVYSRTPWTGGPWAALPAEPEAAAQQLFATLRALDDAGAREIWVESPPSADARWAGVLDRLRRAAAAS